jgi:hypothetical protein
MSALLAEIMQASACRAYLTEDHPWRVHGENPQHAQDSSAKLPGVKELK